MPVFKFTAAIRVVLLLVGLLVAPELSSATGDYDSEAAQLAQMMGWKAGETIAELGAGEGQMSFYAAKVVGSTGHVYTTELDDKKLARLRGEVQRRALKNDEVLKADPIGTNLPDACCDAIFMRRVYHHFANPASTDTALLRALKPGGLLAVIDFPPNRWLSPVENLPPGHHGHGVERDIVVKELKAAGFTIEETPGKWPTSDYCVIARKPSSPL